MTTQAVAGLQLPEVQLTAGQQPHLLDATAKAPHRVWVQLAEVGKFSGHPAGDFELSPHVFSQIIANFMRDKLPIPIDMEHASEQEPTEGSIPTHGAPAVGWIHRLDNRGVGGLWGEVEWLEPAKSYIKEGKYRYISPAIRFESRDRVTGQPIGARLTSAGLTNQPFLRNMQPLVARDGARTAVYCMSTAMPEKMEKGIEVKVHEPPATERAEIHASMAHHPAEYMNRIRACLKLHELATPKECADKLERIRDMHAECGGAKTADGVDLSDYLHSMRTLTGVGLGASWENVFDLMEDLIDAAMDRHEIEEHGGGPTLSDPKVPRPEHADRVEDKAGLSSEHRAADPDVHRIAPDGTDPRDGRGDAVPHGNPPAVPRPDHAHAVETKEHKTINPNEGKTMSDDNKLVVALRDARGEVSELTLRLRDANQELVLAKAENEHLKTLLATQEEAALMDEVAVAFETYKDVKKLTAKDKPHLLAIARSSKDSFRAMFPVVPPNQRYLMRDITPPAPRPDPDALSDDKGRPLSFIELTQRLMSDRKLSFEDAQNEAVRLFRGSQAQTSIY